LTSNLNFSDLRRISETRFLLVSKGADDEVRILDELRLSFIRKVGVRQYVAGMLGRRAYQPGNQCITEEKDKLVTGNGETIVDFLTSRYTPNTLPHRIHVLRQGKKTRVYDQGQTNGRQKQQHRKRYETLWL
jgi:hypothetical protein